MSHETKLRDLEVVKDVYWDAALVTCLKEQSLQMRWIIYYWVTRSCVLFLGPFGHETWLRF